MQAEDVLKSCVFELQKLKQRADRAVAQVPSEDLFRKLGEESNAIAHIMKHLSGNLRARWADFLTTDGEKSDRNRDAEFETEPTDTRESLTERWETGWRCLFDALQKLGPEDLERIVQIRGEPHSVLQAIHRTMTHCANHVGQIILLAKHFTGSRWQTITIPRGKSEEFNAALRRRRNSGYLTLEP